MNGMMKVERPVLELIGHIETRYMSEIHRPAGSGIDKHYIDAMAAAHEFAGYDRALVGTASNLADSTQVIAYVGSKFKSLKFLLSHRPGFMAPTVAARMIATLDQFTDGRVQVHMITGGSDGEMQRDGDFLPKDDRYARCSEYIEVMKKVWTSDDPFDHDGLYYKVRQNFSTVKCAQHPHVPISSAGASAAAFEMTARHASVYALWGETLAQTRETIANVRAALAAAGRTDPIEFSVSLRPILGRTHEEAWERAARILKKVKEHAAQGGVRIDQKAEIQAEGHKRLQMAAKERPVQDKCLWTEVTAVAQAQGNTSALVGAPEEVADAIMDYYDLGVTKFLLRGFDPLEDVLDYGRNLIPLLRSEVAARSRKSGMRVG